MTTNPSDTINELWAAAANRLDQTYPVLDDVLGVLTDDEVNQMQRAYVDLVSWKYKSGYTMRHDPLVHALAASNHELERRGLLDC